MKPLGKHQRYITTLVLTGFVLVGCATQPAFRAPSQYQTRVGGVKTVALMPPHVTVYQLTAGGVTEKMDEWSATAREHLTQALQTHITSAPGIRLTSLPTVTTAALPSQPATWTELDATQALYRVVSTSIAWHAYTGTPNTFPHKVSNFDYTLGPQVSMFAQQAQAEALLFVDAIDHVHTAGRQALTALGVIVGLAVGAYVGPQGGGTAVRVALVDGRSGDILWFNTYSAGSGYDLRTAESCTNIVQAALKGFPLKRE